MHIKKVKDIRALLVIGFLGLLTLGACKEEKSKPSVASEVLIEEPIKEVYVCPSQCENGMNYYLEGKCDICHDNLILKE